MSLEPNIILGKWKVGEKIGRGSFGSVYNVTLKNSSSERLSQYALKLIPLTLLGKDRMPAVKEEIRFLQAVSNLQSFPKLIDKFSFSGFAAIIVTKEYADLQFLYSKSGRAFFLKVTIQKLAFKLVQNLRALHEIGIVHRDIKKNNICIRNTSADAEVVIIDFGLARKFRDTEGNRLPARRDDENRLDKRIYSSINVLETNISTEVDDLIQVCYVLAELRGQFWLIHDHNDQRNMQKKLQLKRDPKSFLPGDDHFLVELFKIVHEQPRFQSPDYDKILETIKNMFPKFIAERPWEWRERNGMLTFV